MASSYVSAVDNYTPKKYGENGNAEYDWSPEINEKFTQIYFQCIRMDKDNKMEIKKFMNTLNEFLITLKKTKSGTEFSPKYRAQSVPDKYYALQNMYRLIGHTRDITEGKGERTLSYMQIYVWYNHFPELAKYAFKTLVHYINSDLSINTSKHQYGSWSDVKYFCDFVKEYSGNRNHELIDYAISLMSDQLKRDVELMEKNQPVSLAARWAPKEHQTKYKWQFKKLAHTMFSFTETSKGDVSFERALKKTYLFVRTQVLSPLNKYLDTVQIKMCDTNGCWSKIDWNTVTSKSLALHEKAWRNLNKNGSIRYSENEDRVVCAENYKNHIERAKNGDKTAKVHGKVMSTYEIVKQAMTTKPEDNTSIDRINMQWDESGKKIISNVGNVIAMADTSASMAADGCLPFYNSIGLSLRISEKCAPMFQNRILTFSTNPEWFRFEESDTFYDKVQKMKPHINCANTDFEKALKMVLDSVVQAELPPKDISSLVLVVLSDMQINGLNSSHHSCWGYNYGQTYDDTMYERIKKMYHHAGMQSKYEVPFEPPHIVFWNLRKTNGFPTSAKTKNVTMISGYSDTLLNAFMDKGIEVLQNFTPVSMIFDILDNDRYNMLGYYFSQYFM
jgi:hypothetical protein